MFAVATLVLCGVATGCSDEQASAGRLPANVQAELPMHAGALYELCPAADLPRAQYEQRARETRRQARALIREVQRRPNHLITRVWEDAHSGRVYRDELTVRALAEEHLRDTGVEGAPCERTLMRRLQHAVDPERLPNPSVGRADERVYRWDDVVSALRLKQRGMIYETARCREVQQILTGRDEVERALSERIRNVEVLVAPDHSVGVEAFRPTQACRDELRRRLRALAGRRPR